ncbi:HIT domain-containing protein [Patescibacteria group bacterium]|nr:HIT domain-containing protein [Patescibacteria group bacterium]
MSQSEPTIFSKIVSGEIPAEILFQNDSAIVIKDIHPKAPVHLLAITKLPFEHIDALMADKNNENTLWELFDALYQVAKQMNLSSYRLVTNCGRQSGQSVPHLHVHLLAGTELAE